MNLIRIRPASLGRLLALAWLGLAAVATADEPKAPKILNEPETAFAIAKVAGKNTTVTIKVVMVLVEVKNEKKSAPPPVEGMPVFKFSEIKLAMNEVKARDIAGNPIPPQRLRTLLADQTAVLLSTSTDPVDPFFLVNSKPETIILHIDVAKLPQPPAPLPVVSPPVLSPPPAPQ